MVFSVVMYGSGNLMCFIILFYFIFLNCYMHCFSLV